MDSSSISVSWSVFSSPPPSTSALSQSYPPFRKQTLPLRPLPTPSLVLLTLIHSHACLDPDAEDPFPPELNPNPVFLRLPSDGLSSASPPTPDTPRPPPPPGFDTPPNSPTAAPPTPSPPLPPVPPPQLTLSTAYHVSLSPPPLIAASDCTGVLLQMSNLPSLSPFFSTNPLPRVPFTLPDGSTFEVGRAYQQSQESDANRKESLHRGSLRCPHLFPSRLLASSPAHHRTHPQPPP
jgi:hypothetical protein